MAAISVFDMLKIGVGPSSSHTLGPWRAAERFLNELKEVNLFSSTQRIKIHLYGSLALTGHGHGTDIAIFMGLSGYDPVTVPVDLVQELPKKIRTSCQLPFGGHHPILFLEEEDLYFHMSESLPFHANGMRLEAWNGLGASIYEATFFSVGGGFVVKEGEANMAEESLIPHPIDQADDLIAYCLEHTSSLWEIVLQNEKSWRKPSEVKRDMLKVWEVMKNCVYRGCHAKGTLPGGLNVARRAASIHKRLLGDNSYGNVEEWLELIKKKQPSFSQIVKWIGCFAMAVNEENANFGRIVTAPTNGSSGVIPAVLFYYICFSEKEVNQDDIVKFLLVAGEIGSLFKKGATISAAMGGCQAEIGVSSAMAAAALTESLGGSVRQSLMAAEIAMEHHLGLTCDPIGGLVQVPCIERNSMGAVKAITAANIALESDPDKARVSLDQVIKTMWETAKDMHTKYKETSQGGLATNISISVPEC
ncbi:MAG: L-serine ammonia-lyase [Saprospiraceae bacterium]|jgi:L-serine dehydratase|nr:L-serine ammonia-lyase [Saprospiraceae bacterium]